MAQIRGRCWSITINNPVAGDIPADLLPGWKIEGQYEQGENGTLHFQGMLTTPTVRFHQVKTTFPRAHIELAVNKKALTAYVHKDESRVGEFKTQSAPTIFELQKVVAQIWNWEVFELWEATMNSKSQDEVALLYVDSLVASLIADGQYAIEFIAVNPMWRTAWKKFFRSIIKRHAHRQEISGSETGGNEGNGTQEVPDSEASGANVIINEDDSERDQGSS